MTSDLSHDEFEILHAVLTSYHPKARAKPRNFIRTHDSPKNLALYDAMVAKGLLLKEAMPGRCYRATDKGKKAYGARKA